MFTAELRCGTVLSYSVRNLRPDVGDVVPCTRHGYCVVQVTASAPPRNAAPTRSRSRTQRGLLSWLRGRQSSSVRALRRNGFTLRLVAAAGRDGLVDVDLVAGRVVLRGPGPERDPWPTADSGPLTQQSA